MDDNSVIEEGQAGITWRPVADDFMENMEDSEDEAAPRGYDDLAAAMAADEAQSSSEEEGEEPVEEADEEAQESGASESGGSSGSGGSIESNAMFGDSSDEEDSDAGVHLATIYVTLLLLSNSVAQACPTRYHAAKVPAHSAGRM
jgi:hypothetical protein